jgi:lipid II:glycine glycyltransferase (peptidoglycan interpeptide bridge formation enzyme)
MKDINATILIYLDDRDEEEVFRSIKYTRRKYIKQAVRAGLSYRQDSSEKSLKKMYGMHMKTLKEGGTATWTYDKWRDFVSAAKDKSFFMEKHNKIIGCFILGEITGKFLGVASEKVGVRPLVFSNLREYNKFRPNDYMYWETIKYSLKNGYSFVDLGGWQMNARGHLKNVNHFKEDWGGKKHFYYIDYPLLTALRRKLIRNFDFFWWLNSLAKKFRKEIGSSVHDKKVRDATARN